MTSLRKHCITKLSPLPTDMSITSKILFARECLAVDWLVDAYNELARRQETISDEEAAVVGIQCAMRILRVREKWTLEREKQPNYNGYVQYTPRERISFDYRENIRLLFRDEIDSLDYQ
jgi:hypothetical protein